jgi:CAAX prenyl protease-like protein
MLDLKGTATSRIAPFALYILFLVFDQPLSEIFSNLGIDARWLYSARVGMIALLLTLMWRGYKELAWPKSMNAKAWLTSLSLGVLVFALWILPFPGWATLAAGHSVFDPTSADGRVNYLMAGIRIAGAALVVPVMEELFWRSFVMRWIDRNDFLAMDPAGVSARAFAFTAMLFALEHELWLAGLLAGVVYGWLYTRYRNLWAPVMSHAVTNGLLGFWVLNNKAWQYW